MIRQTTNGKTVAYSAKDIFEELDLNWRGIRSLPDTVVANYLNINGLNQYALDERAVKAVCKHFKKPFSKLSLTPKVDAEAANKIASLENTVKDLKLVVAQLFTQDNKVRKDLPIKGTSARVLKLDPLQAQARRQIREIVQEYASLRANDLGIKDDNRRIFFDLSFKALYDAYKNKTPNKLDLKALADEETKQTGNKVSGLQIAERLGVAVELLQFTKSFYRI